MSLGSDPAVAAERDDSHIRPETPTNVADDDVERDIDLPPVDEDAVKESPPRAKHTRKTSEPRALGEVIDEDERLSRQASPSSSSSPGLRHPRGRLENVFKERQADGATNGNAVPPATLNGRANSDRSAREATRSSTPETAENPGEDESPQGPVGTAQQRVSTPPPRNPSPEQAAASSVRPDVHDAADEEVLTPISSDQDGTTDEIRQPPGHLVYENLRNKSGENLASIKPTSNFHLSMEQRRNKPPHHEPLHHHDSELVSGRRAGEGWSRSAIRWAPLNVPLQRRLQTLTVLWHTLSIVSWLAFFFLLCGIPILWPILVPYLLYVLFSRASVDGKLYYRSERFRRSKVWSLFASYFPARLHRSQVLEPTRKYIFGYHPHGILSHGAFAAFSTEALGFGQLFPGITNTLLTLDTNFRIPLYRDYALRLGLASVSRESCENILTRGGPNGEGMGRAITIVIGGARESLGAKPYTMRLILKKRKGFVKLAIRTGADLVPVLAFGENDIYDQFDASAHPYVNQAQLFVKKLMGFTVPLFHARGVFNYDVGMMPYRRPINIVVGKPIPIVQSPTPDSAYIDQIHQRYIDELVGIWNEWKDVFAPHRRGELEVAE